MLNQPIGRMQRRTQRLRWDMNKMIWQLSLMISLDRKIRNGTACRSEAQEFRQCLTDFMNCSTQFQAVTSCTVDVRANRTAAAIQGGGDEARGVDEGGEEEEIDREKDSAEITVSSSSTVLNRSKRGREPSGRASNPPRGPRGKMQRRRRMKRGRDRKGRKNRGIIRLNDPCRGQKLELSTCLGSTVQATMNQVPLTHVEVRSRATNIHIWTAIARPVGYDAEELDISYPFSSNVEA